MLAGILIGIAAIINLKCGGIIGAVLFSTGLLVILALELDLFTGKAGLLVSKEIGIGKLGLIWIGNFLGTIIVGIGARIVQPDIASYCNSIIVGRTATLWYVLLWNAFICGVLMYAAVTSFKKFQNPIFPIFCVAAFILFGANHIVAEMFYAAAGIEYVRQLWYLIPVTAGNLIGCCTIPLYKKCKNLIAERIHHRNSKSNLSRT